MKAYKGNIIFTKTKNAFEIYENQYLVVKSGKVEGIYQAVDDKAVDIIDYTDHLIIPGFVDLHTHGPQFRNQGIGLDQELLPWLKNYTFEEEKKFSSKKYAKKIYEKFAKDLLKNGTTHVVLFGTIHNPSNKLLIDILEKHNLHAFVGNVNMDQNASKDLDEKTEESIEKTKALLDYTRNKSINSIVTPRFVPSCSVELMESLGKFAKENTLAIQTHMSENKNEVKLVKKMHPWIQDYIDVYEKYNLINNKTIFAHCVHSPKSEREKIKAHEAYVAHCPNANFNLASGIMPLRSFLKEGINVGLGTDVAAGHTLSIIDVMKSTLQASKLKWFENKALKPVTVSEVFYLATKGGGSFFGKVGSFEKGYDFNALIIEDDYELYNLNLEERIERLIFTGDDRLIKKIITSRSNSLTNNN
jgi:guanine deaminase